jgi:colanic acid/amylovoran biosynthesis protein
MIIQIDGTNTLNKGAELMTCAVVEAIDEKYSNKTIVYINSNEKKLPKIKANLTLSRRLILGYGRYPAAILRKLGLPYSFFTINYVNPKIDVLIDAGGFQFSDQWNYDRNYLNLLEGYYKKLYDQGTKIIFLPQALGPFESEDGKRIVSFLNKYATIIIAREQTSYNYIIKGIQSKNKVWCYPDFTLKVKGELSPKYQSLVNGICIIPNKKMISHSRNTLGEYLNFYKIVFEKLSDEKQPIFLLNHEGNEDLELCKIIQKEVWSSAYIVTGLTAKEVKGVIGAASIVISSRFHGVASALSQEVPCLATSWSHKYELLFNDYKINDSILDIKASKEVIDLKLSRFLENRVVIKKQLAISKKQLTDKINEMWSAIFSLI